MMPHPSMTKAVTAPDSRRTPRRCVFGWLGCGLVCLVLGPATAEAAGLRAGVAKIDISDRTVPVHDPCHARALVLESAPQCGTTATLWLPVSAQLPAAAEPPPLRAAAPSAGQGLVLVVDDEPLVLESTAAMLEELGYEPLCAGSGEAALQLLSDRAGVAAVLTDHAMPGMTGAALAARLRHERPGLPVVVASGFAGAWSEGGAPPPRLAKPYSLAQLSEALDEALAARV